MYDYTSILRSHDDITNCLACSIFERTAKPCGCGRGWIHCVRSIHANYGRFVNVREHVCTVGGRDCPGIGKATREVS